MTPEELIIRVQALEGRLNKFEKSNFFFEKDLQMADGRKIIGGTTTGLKIGTATTQKLGFYGVTPVVQNSSPNGKQDKSGSGGANVTDGTGYDGNVGTTYYTIGDIVYALKQLGFLAQ